MRMTGTNSRDDGQAPLDIAVVGSGIAGMASALGGTLQMVFGAIMIVVVSFFFDGTALPMVATIAACSLGAFLLGLITLRKRTEEI